MGRRLVELEYQSVKLEPIPGRFQDGSWPAGFLNQDSDDGSHRYCYQD